MKKILLILVPVLSVISCGAPSKDSASDLTASGGVMVAAESAPMALKSARSVKNTAEIPEEATAKKIIKDGSMGIKVRDINEGKSAVDALVAQYNAYYGNESYNDYKSSVAFDLTVRVPSKDYENFIADIEAGDGEVVYKNIDTRDVTEQFYDLETRLENKRSYLARYRELLKRANTVKDILEIETYIRGLEEEIESTEGRLRLLSNQVDYSTLRLNITQDKELAAGPSDSFWYRLKNALSSGWNGFVSFIVLLFYVWPLWIIAVVVVGIIYYNVRRNRKKTAK